MGIIASVDKSAWTAVVDVTLDETARGEGKRGGAAPRTRPLDGRGWTSTSWIRLRRSTVWCTAADGRPL